MVMPAPAPRLMAITDLERAPAEAWVCLLGELAQRAAPGSVIVQLRDRALPVRERRHFGERLRELTRRTGQLLWVNDRLDLALVLGADGVHLPEAGVSVEDARGFATALGRDWLVSAACHVPERFAASTADAVVLSPVLEARKGLPALGVRGLELARRRGQRRELGPRALYALGGVTPHDAAGLLEAGADGVAAIGGLLTGAATDWVGALGIER